MSFFLYSSPRPYPEFSILWEKLCKMSKLVSENRRLSALVTELDSRNDTWTVGHVYGDIQTNAEERYQLDTEIRALLKTTPPRIANEMVISSFKLYNS